MPGAVLSLFSPLPPEENGIADYAYHLLPPLSSYYDCAAYVADPHAIVPDGVQVHDPAQAFRHLGQDSRILYQIGNNPGHIFALQALRRWPGVTTLHDQNLHYLYEMAGAGAATLQHKMQKTSARMGSAYARHWHQENVKTKANYVLFDMLDEVLAASAAIVVHSHFAKRRITALYGQAHAAHIAVIPHLAIPFTVPEPEAAAAQLKIPPDLPLIVTSGFATAAKRFDWLVEALDEIGLRGGDFFWVHAGKERPEEYALSELLERHPFVRERTRITGYISENDLNQYILASDLLVNLRFPSVGESSGTLARGMTAGRCCIVSDTAAYSELPRDTVVHIPVNGAIGHLVEALQTLLTSEPARREIGARARRFSAAAWSPDLIAAAYHDVIEESLPPRNVLQRPSRASGSASPIRIKLSGTTNEAHVMAAIGPSRGELEILFIVEKLEDLVEISLAQPRLLAALLPPAFSISAIHLQSEGQVDSASQTILLRIKGTLQ
jgi:glycosyltransferase involved in cell wall biosynthesis